MDKRTIIGIVLIVLITISMPFYQRWITGDQPPPRKPTTIPSDTSITEIQPDSAKEMESQLTLQTEPESEEIIAPDTAAGFMIEEQAEEKTITIENDLLLTTWSSRGGGNPLRWELKNYKHFRGGLVDLIQENALKLNFLNIDGKEINLNNYNLYTDAYDGKKVDLNQENPEFVIEYYLPVRGGRIVKTMTFYYDRYSYDLAVRFEGLQGGD